jgi:ferrous iron transport protein A
MDGLAHQPSTGQVIPLGSLEAGASGVVARIEGQPNLVLRLQEMGVRPGCHVRMIQPGAACVVAVGNHRFGFRGADVAHVLVEVSGSAAVAS